MLTKDQLSFFETQGYLIVENVFDQENILTPVRSEYAALLDKLIKEWVRSGVLSAPPEEADFYEKLNFCYQAGCDWLVL